MRRSLWTWRESSFNTIPWGKKDVSDIFILSTDAYKAASADAEARYPEESCGFIVDGSFVSLKNKAIDKLHSFRVSTADYDKYKGRIEAVIHSHPEGGNESEADIHAQFALAIPYVILIFSGKVVGSIRTLDL